MMQNPSLPRHGAGTRLSAVALATLALCASHVAHAQAHAAPAGTGTQAPSGLAVELQRKFEADEAAVAAYLAAHPGVQREVVKDGVPHRIVRMGSDGNPVWIKSKAGGPVSRSNVESGQLIKADSLYSGGSLGVDITGQSMVVGVWEPGVPRATHELLAGKVTIESSQAGDTGTASVDHATHVTGTIVGKAGLSGDGASARGVAYDATARNWDSSNDTTEMATAGAATSAAVAASNALLVSNHSYGYANDNTTLVWQLGAYDSEARSWDQLTAAAPYYLPFVAAGNEQQSSPNFGAKAGYDVISGASAAKNAMTVGAVNADKSMSAYSNWGPTDDGRVKPEIVARGTGINSAQSASDTAYSGSGAGSSGTSYATPAASAAALLLQQYYASLNNGAYMRASTLKTLIMGTAEDLGQPGPDYKFGYGLMNVEAAANAIKKNSIVTLSNGSLSTCAHGTATAPNGCGVLAANSNGALIYEWNADQNRRSAAGTTTTADGAQASELAITVTAKGGTPLVINLGWTDDAGTEQVANDGTDPTAPRAAYDYDVLVRGGSPSTDNRTWVLPGMANRAADATRATGWFQGNGGPFRQVVIANPTANASYTIYVRKLDTSPRAQRTLSLVVTGMAEPLPVNGSCATLTPLQIAAPSAGLCTTGTATSVTTNASSYTWGCNGTGSGTSTAANACTVTRGYTVTGSTSGNGTISPANQVAAYNATPTLTLTPTPTFVGSASGCGGSLNGSTYTTGAITGNCTVTATFTPTMIAPPPPAPSPSPAPAPAPEPAPAPTVNAGSNTNASSGVVEVHPGAGSAQAPGSLSLSGTVQMALGGTSPATIGAQSVGEAPAQIRFTQTANGTLVPNVQAGTVVFTVPTGTDTGGTVSPRPVLPIATQPPGSESPTARLVTTTDVPCSQGHTTLRVAVAIGSADATTRVDVGGCPVNLTSLDGASSARASVARADTGAHTGATVYPGEQMVLDAQNRLVAIQLGSSDPAARTLAGANVSAASAQGLSVDSFTPRLAGAVQRLQGQDLGQLLSAQFQAMPALSELVLLPDTGRVMFRHNGQHYTLSAIGRVHVDTDLTPPRQASAQGGVVLNAAGVAVEFAPSVLNLSALHKAVSQGGGTLSVQADGSYVATLAGVPHAMKATSELGQQTDANPTDLGESRLTAQRDAGGSARQFTLDMSFGRQQTLVPAAADLAGLKALLAQADAGAQVKTPLAIEEQGRLIEVTLGGVAYRLQPGMALVPVPADKVGQAYWVANGLLYVAVPAQAGWAQVFSVR